MLTVLVKKFFEVNLYGLHILSNQFFGKNTSAIMQRALPPP
jgi:hypothetical protein